MAVALALSSRHCAAPKTLAVPNVCVWMCVCACGCVWMCVDVCGCVQQREKEDRQSLTYPRVIGVVLLPESLMKGMVFRKLQPQAALSRRFISLCCRHNALQVAQCCLLHALLFLCTQRAESFPKWKVTRLGWLFNRSLLLLLLVLLLLLPSPFSFFSFSFHPPSRSSPSRYLRLEQH